MTEEMLARGENEAELCGKTNAYTSHSTSKILGGHCRVRPFLNSIKVRACTTISCVQSLRDHPESKIAALNFASGCVVGGGFLDNRRGAQEEANARSSDLFFHFGVDLRKTFSLNLTGFRYSFITFVTIITINLTDSIDQ